MDLKLVMFRTDGKRRDFPIVGHSATIGRGEECDLRVPLLSVSRRHCQVLLEDDKAIIKDLGSSNGTYVNNKQVGEQELRPGDRLVVGSVVFTVQIDGEPEEIQPPKVRAKKRAASAAPAEPAAQGQPAKVKPGEDTHAPVAGEEAVDPISDLEDLVAEALKEDEEESEDSTASRT